MQVLIVFNEGDDNILLTQDVTLDVFEELKTFHNKFINQYSENKKQQEIQDQIEKKMLKYFYTKNYRFKFKQAKSESIIYGYFDAVINCGFLP